MDAREIMTENPICCIPSDGLQMAARHMVEYNCGFLPVVESQDNRRLVGVLTDRDIVARVVARGVDCNSATVQDAMTTGRLWSVAPDAVVDEVIDKMEEGQVRRIPVVDAENGVVGVIATADIALELDEVDEIAEVFEEISEPTNSPRM